MHSPQELLAAFENEKLGEDTPRHDGKIEMGSGAAFHKLSDADKQRHAALVEMIDTDAEVSKAQAALDAAILRHAAVAKRAGVEIADDDSEEIGE